MCFCNEAYICFFSLHNDKKAAKPDGQQNPNREVAENIKGADCRLAVMLGYKNEDNQL